MDRELQGCKAVGIAGGGQLALMMIPAARKLGLQVFVLDPDQDCASARDADRLVVGDFSSAESLIALSNLCDVITFEIEKVSADLLGKLEEEGKAVRPGSAILNKIQDKLVQKSELRRFEIPVSFFEDLKTRSDLPSRVPCVWKARTVSYDGRGVSILKDVSDLIDVPDIPGYTEELVDIKYELAILIARSVNGETVEYPVAEIIMDEQSNIMDTVVVPSVAPDHLQKECRRIALKLVDAYDYVGVMAIEFFVDNNDKLFVNEISPRPHNSGHYTIEACKTSQFEQHLRAITNKELGSAELISPAATLNILGPPGAEGKPIFFVAEALSKKTGVYVHNYGKARVNPGRKMGHVTVTGESREEVLVEARKLQHLIRVEGGG